MACHGLGSAAIRKAAAAAAFAAWAKEMCEVREEPIKARIAVPSRFAATSVLHRAWHFPRCVSEFRTPGPRRRNTF